MWTRSNRNGKFQVRVWNLANELIFDAEFSTREEADRAGEIENRKVASQIFSEHKMSEADWNDPLLDMSDDELLAALTAA